MYRSNGKLLFSASDLVGFLECEHFTSLQLTDLETPLPRAEDDAAAVLVQEKGHHHERLYLEQLQSSGARVTDLSALSGDVRNRIACTLEEMRAGAEIIYQGALGFDDFIGYPDFLRRVEVPSELGPFSYEVIDTKLATSVRTKFIVQLAFYSDCLARAQGAPPVMMHLVLGDRREVSLRFADYAKYVAQLRRRFEERVRAGVQSTYPDPCAYCDQCKWRQLCDERRIADDHLCQVANITRIQIKKLQDAGIRTLAALGSLDGNAQVPRISPQTLDRIRNQARLQLEARTTGSGKVERLPVEGEGRGFARLPRPSPHDLFFDMEGDPYEENGLEYLFGLYFFDEGKPQFRAFWAHSRAEERRAFEEFMKFAVQRLTRYPDAHIYHYAHYEPTHLQGLMSLHGTQEAELDNLLRRRKFVDLYAVVREAIRVSEPRYSIKNIEHFYLEARSAEVVDAGASIVYYERWKETRDPQYLKAIEAYNLDDVRSTYQLREWLLTLRPPESAWAADGVSKDGEPVKAGELTKAEQRLIPYRRALLETLPNDRTRWGRDEELRELTYHLLDFHRRADKPAWWAMFKRMEMSHAELLEDPECLADLRLTGPPVRDKQSFVWTFQYPEQETKLRTGVAATLASTGEGLGKVEVDEEARQVRIRRGVKREPLPEQISIGPGRPIGVESLVNAVFRFADSLLAGANRYPAAEAFLRRDLPRFRGVAAGTPIIPKGEATSARIAAAISDLDCSYLFIQGPPGAGKTHTGSHAIVSLLRAGFRVGVSSNSHKAINNLLQEVEKIALEQSYVFRGAKKSKPDDQESLINGAFIEDVFDNADINPDAHQLIAGTAWVFSDPALDQKLDFLFVDEAGQVSVANLVAMATSARNVVLLGDQMQLGQPIQGVHPGESGLSSLDYLLQGAATIAPERGIFLETTYRMNPSVCQFISDAVYDGRLKPEPRNANQVLLLDTSAAAILKARGLQFVAAQHDGCSQSSAEEAEIVRGLVERLLTQRYRDKFGVEHPMGLDNILVVAPYNMQVNLLKRVLPAGARVGTVDKFQGQQAEVVIVSMTTSSNDYMPRFVDFLFSKNRLNVAISRARTLAVVIANPELLRVRCRSAEDMALVNTLCWAREYAESA